MAVPLVEHVAVPDIFVTGLARIEELGGNLRFTFYALKSPLAGDCSSFQRVVVSRLVMPRQAVTVAAMQALAVTDTMHYYSTLPH